MYIDIGGGDSGGVQQWKKMKKTQRNSRVHCYFFLIIGGVSIYGI